MAESGVARVLLIGLMGTGKTSIGRAVSARTGWPYLDNDELLERANSSDLVSLSARGPAGLHGLETAVVRDVLARPGSFVAGVAASVIEDPAVRHLLTTEAFTVYLHAAPATLAARVGDGTGRPYLRPDPLTALTRMYAERDALYRGVAALVLEVDLAEADDLAAQVLDALG